MIRMLSCPSDPVIPMERWKDIPGFEGLYQASNTGLIRSAPGKVTSSKRFSRRVWKTRILKHKFRVNRKRRDAAVTLWKDGKCKDYLVSRLVAMTWVDGYEPSLTVNHIDGNPQNNNCSNLEWVTLSENIKKGYANGLFVQQPIMLKCSENEFSFVSMAEGSRFLGRNHGYIYNCLKCNRPIKDTDGKCYSIFFMKEVKAS